MRTGYHLVFWLRTYQDPLRLDQEHIKTHYIRANKQYIIAIVVQSHRDSGTVI